MTVDGSPKVRCDTRSEFAVEAGVETRLRETPFSGEAGPRGTKTGPGRNRRDFSGCAAPLNA
jgi:hypothetical protein